MANLSENYTKLWTEKNFDEDSCDKYHKKFFNRFEKTMKHNELIFFLEPYVKKAGSWLDFPIGSGRLYDHFLHGNFTGADLSDTFIEYNQKKGITVLKKDINEFQFDCKFDLITCTNTLFAFPNFKKIIVDFKNALADNGILVVDLVNKDHIEFSNHFLEDYKYPNGFHEEEIVSFFKSIGMTVKKIEYHDFYDNRFLENIYRTNNKMLYYIGRIFYKTCTYIIKKPFGFKLLTKLKFSEKRLTSKYLIAAQKSSFEIH